MLDNAESYAVRFRPDLRDPPVTIITETDLCGGPRRCYYAARQPDSQWLRGTVRGLYPGGVADYLERFTGALDSAIQPGFILAAEREEILQLAAATFTTAKLQGSS
ncbi:hypothetical protein [Candidatus Mycobacterium methanotrophicum]|uniref:hypothetical protein n=1 Tax=Candidatus Mycobacterium methanotrophicum TaxID=2943498 RepID=UPI001C55BEF9|nr:hypothetical protein [Candidatus Mycobacterium methanotrophicum]